MGHTFDVTAPANGTIGNATVTVLDESGNVVTVDKADLSADVERQRISGRLAKKLKLDPQTVCRLLEKEWVKALNGRREGKHRQGPTATPARPIIAVQKLEPYQPFPIEQLPEPICGFVDAASRAVGCDASYIALPLLTALAAAIGNSRTIRLKHGWTEPAVLWSAIVGESGTLKSPALDAPLRPIRERQAEALRQHQTAMIQYEQDKAVYDMQVKQWKSKAQKNGDAPPVEPTPPVCERFWVSDVTVEALAARLANAHRGLLLVRDELAGWIASFGQYKAGKGADSAHFLTMHGARDLLVDRKSGDQTTTYVPRAALSITGGIQPGILRTALAHEHFQSGLAARLLLAMPPRTPKRWSEMEIVPELESELANLFDQLFGLTMPLNPVTEEPAPVALPLSRDGKAAWVQYYNEHAIEQAEMTGDLAAAWSKLEGYSARLALVIHLVRVASGNPAVDAAAVDAQSVEAGVALSRWFGREAQRVYAVLSETDAQREHRGLLELIGRKGGRITVRELMHGNRRYCGNADSALAVLETLVSAGALERKAVQPGPRGGRPYDEYSLVTTGNGNTTPGNTGEN